MAKKIILDVDTGSDDSVAIALAALNPDIDLVAVCSVAGNQPLPNTTENSARVLDLVKSDAPLYKGCPVPMVHDICPWRVGFESRADAIDENGEKIHIHAEYLPLPPATKKPEAKHAVQFYVDYLREATEPVTIVAVGPLTNVATALVMDPTIVKNIEEIVIMGGGDNESNSSISSEFNIWYDPEAAQRVFHCGAKITLVPLDATHATPITQEDCERFRKIGTPVAEFCAGQCEQRILVHTQQQPLEIPDSCALHDPLCVAYLIDPTVLTDVRLRHVEVSLSGLTDGSTMVDHRYYPEGEKNVWFAYRGDRKKFADILADAFERNV